MTTTSTATAETPSYMRRYADEHEAWHAARPEIDRRTTVQAGIANDADPRLAPTAHAR